MVSGSSGPMPVSPPPLPVAPCPVGAPVPVPSPVVASPPGGSPAPVAAPVPVVASSPGAAPPGAVPLGALSPPVAAPLAAPLPPVAAPAPALPLSWARTTPPANRIARAETAESKLFLMVHLHICLDLSFAVAIRSTAAKSGDCDDWRFSRSPRLAHEENTPAGGRFHSNRSESHQSKYLLSQSQEQDPSIPHAMGEPPWHVILNAVHPAQPPRSGVNGS